jgi:hypothetical protein
LTARILTCSALSIAGLLFGSFSANASDVVRLPLADGFDFPVGKPNSIGYYKARGFWPNGHMGEDWNGKGGGNTDLGDPVYSMADGIVVQSRDVRVGWGNVVIIRHVFRDNDGKIKYVDSLYGHLNVRNVVLNQRVKRGQKVGTIGTAHGKYLAHLHFETRKNLYIGMHRSKFTKTYSNYHSPTTFIRAHRQCQTSSKLHSVPINTFAPYPGGRPVKYNGQTPTIAGSSKPAFSIPVAQRRSTPKPTSRTSPSSRKPAPSSKPKLDPKVEKIITENRKKTPETKPPAPKRRGLLSRLRSRYSKDGDEKKRRGGFSNR